MKLPCLFVLAQQASLSAPMLALTLHGPNTAISSFRDKTFVFAMICINSTIAFTVRQIHTNAFSRCALRRIGREVLFSAALSTLGDKLAPTRFVLSGSRHRYLKSAKTSPPIQNEDYRPASPLSFSPFPLGLITSRSFLLLSALPLASNGGFTIMAKRKATAETTAETTAEELRAQAESNGYKRGAYREQDSTRDITKQRWHQEATKEDVEPPM